ncbi:hypothetical protein BO71DRAFT_433672 [Aspergillus ellipticus CBS 707.79]|uniref:Actin-like ATPase domain-containing protein n=1 Tax=Aspergillus ellipticus CBS 707.79 TaxID=1448320 RepID=A0A319D097_9EURO|nr:hypothetical protein BO71DRAFT_433672 [Aspergillus ellipticus CBS 707.79]
MVQPRLIIGLDYGTTATGVAWTRAVDDRHQQYAAMVTQVQNWPGKFALKTPSRWGFQTAPGPSSYSWTKLLLDPSPEAARFQDSDLESLTGEHIMRLPPNKKAVDVIVGDYIRQVRAFLLQEGFLPQPLEEVTRDIVFTIPENFPPSARTRMREAIVAVGFGESDREKVILISEAESSAIFALRHVQPGESFCVADCGGGTIKLVITGGLANQEYIKAKLKTAFYSLEVIVPNSPETAASHGANAMYDEGDCKETQLELLHCSYETQVKNLTLYSSDTQNMPRKPGGQGLTHVASQAFSLSRLNLDHVSHLTDEQGYSYHQLILSI